MIEQTCTFWSNLKCQINTKIFPIRYLIQRKGNKKYVKFWSLSSHTFPKIKIIVQRQKGKANLKIIGSQIHKMYYLAKCTEGSSEF